MISLAVVARVSGLVAPGLSGGPGKALGRENGVGRGGRAGEGFGCCTGANGTGFILPASRLGGGDGDGGRRGVGLVHEFEMGWRVPHVLAGEALGARCHSAPP